MRRVRILGLGPARTGVQVLNSDGSPIKGITAVDVQFRPGECPKAEVNLHLAEVDADACAEFVMSHPTTGERKVVASIIFADGETVVL